MTSKDLESGQEKIVGWNDLIRVVKEENTKTRALIIISLGGLSLIVIEILYLYF
jgi:hypothetical protein